MSLLAAALVLTLSSVPVETAGPSAARPVRGAALLASAVVPGTGELILGSNRRGEAMLWFDGALWGALVGLSWYGASRESDARLYASRWAGADLRVAEARYYKALEGYDDADDFNEQVRSDARFRFPDDPARQRRYYDSLAYLGQTAWNWTSDSARYEYWNLRRSGRSAGLTAQFVVAALVLNRLVSVLDCAFFVRTPVGSASVGLRPEGMRQSRIEFSPGVDEPGIKLSYRF